MPVAKAEQRLPAGFTAADLGQSATAQSGKIVLVSYHATPVAQGRAQTYVVFVTDATLRAQVNTFQWQIQNADTTTQEGVFTHTPTQAGSLTLNVTLRDNANAAVGTISLSQTVTQPNEDLENLITQDNATHPVAGDPPTSREVINDFLGHLHAIAPVATAEILNRLLFGISYVEAQATNQATRDRTLASLRTHINAGNTNAAQFFTAAASGAGICNLRPEILAMTLQHGGSPLIPWQAIPHVTATRTTALATLQTTLAALAEDRRIDLFNVLRFPKASLKACQMILDKLRTQYFSNHTYDAIIANNTEAQQLIYQLKTGPFSMTPPLPTISAYPNRVVGRMVSTLWFQIAKNPPPGGGAIGGLGAIPAPPTLFGTPEHVPEETYVVQALQGDNGFIAGANTYHTTYGLNPTTITSLEHCLDLIDNRATHLARLRIVGHVGVNAAATQANLNVPFFENSERIVTEEMLNGFGESDEKGLWAILDPQHYANPTGPNFHTLVNNIIHGLRAINNAVLVPFNLHNSLTHTGDLSKFLYIGSDLVFTNIFAANAAYATITRNNVNLNAAQRGHLTTAFGHILDGIAARLATGAITAAQVTALRNAIAGLDYWALHGPNPIFNSLTANILSHLRAHNTAALTPFGLATTGSPSGALQGFFAACSDKLFATLVFASAANGAITFATSALTNAQQTALQTALDGMISGFSGQVVGTTIGSTTITNAHMTTLRTAILGMTMANLGLSSLGSYGFGGMGSINYAVPANTIDMIRLLGDANAAIGRNFRAKLTAVKARLDKNSWIDIRGCRVGQVQSYLQAIQKFFGRTGNLPAVTGPQWFQSFPNSGFTTLVSQAQVDTLWAGHAGNGHTGAEVQAAFTKASRYAGIASHMTFWTGVSNLDNFQFAALLWKGSLPATPIEATRLQNFDTLDFSDTMTRVGAIFDITITAAHNTAFTRIEARLPQMNALQSEINTISQLGTPPVASELTQSFNRLQQINTQLGLTVVPAAAPSPLTTAVLTGYTNLLKKYFEIVTIPNGPVALFNAHVAIEALATQASPPAAQLTAQFTALSGVQTTIAAAGVVPAAAPNPLTAATLQGYVTQLLAHLNTTAHLVTFKAALLAACQHAQAAFRYYFFIGLALLVDEYNNHYFYTLHTLRDQAIRSFMRAHWQGNIPTPNSIAASVITANNPRQVSVLTDVRPNVANGQIGIDPYEEFANNLVTENATP